MASEFQVSGQNTAAPFTLKLHRGDGMALVAMNWKKGKPPINFVGFAIEYKEPGGDRFYALKNRLSFPGASGEVDANSLSTLHYGGNAPSEISGWASAESTDCSHQPPRWHSGNSDGS